MDPPKEKLPLPTHAQLDILVVLWRVGQATVREVHAALGKDSGYTTTLKQMQLMVHKGLVVRSERFRSHIYEAAVPKQQIQTELAGDMLKRAFDGSARTLVLSALLAQPIGKEGLAEIRKMINRFAKGSGLRRI